MKKHRDVSWLPYMAKTKNYIKWIYDQYKDHIGNSVMDIGCGYGTFVDFIKDKKRIILVEVSRDMIDRLKRKYRKNGNIRVVKHDISISPLKLAHKVDSVVCLNVLEHIKDDRSAIRNIRKNLKKNGKLILYVPAKRFLYGTLDDNLGHYRRYEKGSLEEMLISNKFRIIKSRYMNILGLLSWYLYGRILKSPKVKEKRILLYDKLFIPILSRIEDLINPPSGQSLLIIAEAK